MATGSDEGDYSEYYSYSWSSAADKPSAAGAKQAKPSSSSKKAADDQSTQKKKFREARKAFKSGDVEATRAAHANAKHTEDHKFVSCKTAVCATGPPTRRRKKTNWMKAT